MQGVAAAWLMTLLTSSAFLIGLVPAAASAPFLIFAPFAGTVADLCDRRRMLLVTQSALFFLTAILAVFTLSGSLKAWGLLLLIAGFGTTSAFNNSCWQRIIQDVVGRADLPAAVSLHSMSFNLARGVAPALGGLLVAAIGAGMVFVLNSLSCFGMIFTALWWKNPQQKNPAGHAGWGRAMLEGMRYVVRFRLLRWLLIRNLLFMASVTAALALLPLIARDQFSLGAGGFGMLSSVFGAGCLLGALISQPLQKNFGDRKVTPIGILICSGMLALLAFGPQLWMAGVALFFSGLFNLIVGLNHNLRVRLCVPEEFSGRVFAYHMMSAQGGTVLGGVLFGAIATRLQPTGALAVASLLALACFGLAQIHPLPDYHHSGSRP